MQKALYIYNPVAGTGQIAFYFDYIIGYFQEMDISIVPLRAPFREEMLLSLLKKNDFHYIFVAGGDGTLNKVASFLVSHSSPPPLGVIPSGTTNDFACSLGLPHFAPGIKKMQLNETFFVDVGQIGSRYFINVASGGLLVDIAHRVDQKAKNNLGVMAYYLKGVTKIPAIPSFKTVEVEVRSGGKKLFQGEIFLFLILNGKSAGTFNHMAPEASLNDGLLDCLFFRKCSPKDFLNLFLKVIAGRHMTDNNVLYFQASELYINGCPETVTDLDGEEGLPLPWKVELLPQRLEILKLFQ